MLYRVVRPFRQGSAVRRPGQIVELEFAQAARFRAMGLIGNVPRERAVTRPPERAVVPDPPRKKRAPRKKPPEVPVEDPEVGGDGSE